MMSHDVDVLDFPVSSAEVKALAHDWVGNAKYRGTASIPAREVLIEAIRLCPTLSEFLEEPLDEDMQVFAMQCSGLALQTIANPSERVIEAALRDCSLALTKVRQPTPRQQYLAAVRPDGQINAAFLLMHYQHFTNEGMDLIKPGLAAVVGLFGQEEKSIFHHYFAQLFRDEAADSERIEVQIPDLAFKT